MPEKNIDFPEQIDLDMFVSKQAHDLRTPFNHITGFSKMLLNTVGLAPLTDYQKEDLGTVYRSGMRALSLLNGLIDLARIHRHEKLISSQEIDIEQMVSLSLDHWKKFNPGITTQVDYQVFSSTRIINADEQFNRQIISGFISYVDLFCESNSSVSITVSEQPGTFLFTFTSTGVKSRHPSELDLEMLGYINKSLIELQKGEILQAVETDDGAIVRYSLPKY
jgi:K+-sensing histidine kinase KdpD